MKYAVELYNKDGDNYKTVYETDDFQTARQVCVAFDNLCVKDMIIDSESVYTEPFDWAEVYNNDTREVVYMTR
jgi:hypothetical protein